MSGLFFADMSAESKMNLLLKCYEKPSTAYTVQQKFGRKSFV